MAERGYYSLIQYMPDHGRAEGANVGVVLVCPARGAAHVAMSANNEGPKRRFGKVSFDDSRLTMAKEALAGRLQMELAEHPTLDALTRSRSLEGNALVLSEPRAVAVDGPVVSVAEALCKELVYLHERRRDRARAPDASWIVDFLESRNVPIEKPGEVLVPVIEEPLKVAFAYLNGAHHFVHSHGFSKDRHEALKQARDVGAQGRLLYRHSDQHLRRQLVVLGSVANQDLASTLEAVFHDFNVRLIPEDKVEAFAQEVAGAAHAPAVSH